MDLQFYTRKNKLTCHLVGFFFNLTSAKNFVKNTFVYLRLDLIKQLFFLKTYLVVYAILSVLFNLTIINIQNEGCLYLCSCKKVKVYSQRI